VSFSYIVIDDKMQSKPNLSKAGFNGRRYRLPRRR
jgi:hypothetical protein